MAGNAASGVLGAADANAFDHDDDGVEIVTERLFGLSPAR